MDEISISLLVVDDEASVRDSLYQWFLKDGYRVKTASNAKEALQILSQEKFDLLLIDIKMPGMDGLELFQHVKRFEYEPIVIIMTAFASVETAVQALKDGAFDYITKPFDPDELSHLVRNAVRQLSLTRENKMLKERISNLEHIDNLVGNSRSMVRMLEEIERVSQTDSPVIIFGESGTGKELVAKAIHSNSPRKLFQMVTVHCGALTESLLESELFGHEKGAFTGAIFTRKGRFEMADGGTIFLDEIATISAKMQVELLRVLESKTFFRVGGTREIKSDFRIICATNKDLKKMVELGEFREDLYYRLNVVSINVPPLRKRKEDIPILVEYFIDKFCKAMSREKPKIDPSAMKWLTEYDYPGNIRELENIIERALVIGNSQTIRVTDLPTKIREHTITVESLEDVEKEHIQRMLDKYHWNISQAARSLKLDRSTLYKKINKYKLKPSEN